MKKILGFLLIPYSLFLTTDLCFAQIAINNTAANPDASAILDLNSGNSGVNKGFLAPQVALTASNSAAPVTSPATGLIVYNTATAGTPPNNVVPGYYYWSGSYWWGLGAPTMASGVADYVARFTPTGKVLGTGMIQDNGVSVGINGAPQNAILYTNSTRAAGDSSIGATYGVYGSGNNYGGLFISSQGYGVEGISYEHSVGIGVSGYCDSSYGYGVFGEGSYVGVEGEGDYGIFGNGASYGVLGRGNIGGEFDGEQQGVVGVSSDAAGDSSIGVTYGVYGSGNYYGGYFTSTHGYGALGITTDHNGVGLYGIDDSAYGYGVYGEGAYIGVDGEGSEAGVFAGGGFYGIEAGGTYGGDFYGDNQGIQVYGHAAAADSAIGATYGGHFNAVANSGIGVYGGGPHSTGHAEKHGEGLYGEGLTYGVVGYADTTAGNATGGFFVNNCGAGYNAYVAYYFGGTEYKIYGGGTVSTHVKDNNNTDRIMNCPEAPEILFEDYGEGQLVNGKAHIDLDPTIAKNVCISAKHPLRVFIQLEDNENCKGVVVKNKSVSGFDVVELSGGVSTTPFQWHIVANRADELDANGKVVNKNADNRFVQGPDNDEKTNETKVRVQLPQKHVKHSLPPKGEKTQGTK
jgi:hypothetical protein